MSSVGETEISTDEVLRVELSDNGEGEHSYDGGTNGWDNDIGHSMNNDDDEDNWSRQVETDEVIHRMPSSVTGGDTITIGDDDDGQGGSTLAAENGDSREQQHQPVLIPQPRPLPTMKEKLVERERQRRVESERARWKRQFAMAAHAEAEHDEDDNNHGASGDENYSRGNIRSDSITDHDHSFVNDRNSVAGTVGEDTVAPIDTLEEHNNDANMTYPMERFLQDQHGSEIEDQNNNTKKEPQGVVMERFLQEQPTAVAGAGGSLPPSSVDSVHGSVPNESSIRRNIDDDVQLLNLSPDDGATNMIENEMPEEPMGDNPFQSPSQQPRVLRLTEAEIQEMAAIDDASRSNAPPSERDDISELGELVSDFGLTHIDNQNMSQGTPVTAQESVTSSVGNQIGQITVLSGSTSDHGMIDGLEAHSISSNVVASSAGGDVSLTGNPPSEVADDDTRGILSPRSSQVPTEILPTTTTVEVSTSPYATVPIPDTPNSNDGPGADEIIVNRTMRPGLFNYKEHQQANPFASEEIKKSANRQIPADVDPHVEGFDFDKDNYASPPQNDILATPNDMWSPGFSDHSKNIPDYGATEDVVENLQMKRFTEPEVDDEKKPLLGGVPPAVNVTIKSHRRESPRVSLWSVRNKKDLNSMVECVFSDIRYESSRNRLSISNELDDSLDSTMLKGVISGRMLTLIVTLVLELPTLFLIAGGSDELCNLIGRTKFTTVVALLPIVSAMSGIVAVEASVSTARAIRDGHLKAETYPSWLAKEIKTAGFLGTGMGLIAGSIAFMMGAFSIPFALSIFTAQFIGVSLAGCTGGLAPFFIGLLSQRDSRKWGGLPETAVQDVVASFAMIVISYQIMLLFGPYEIGSHDMCSAPI
mmetsp:Transcript_7889/g.19356  ORF Transcript_7889/g.19356 Transcript_7889/m.19356 type:complete len:873 (+) Transcript_7889:135-2753(+)